MAVVCVDAGTTMIKVVGYAEDGAEQVVVRRPTEVRRPAPGHVEQDMDEVWRAVASGLREVRERLGGAPVSYVAVTAQGDGCWLVDASGRPTGPAILWNDGRAADTVGRWMDAGVMDTAFRTNGSVSFAGVPTGILTWLRAHDPDRLARSAATLTCGGWIFSQLTGEIAVDESDAAVPFMDIGTHGYSDDLLRLYDMEWARPLLPEIHSDDRRVAGLTASAADALGLPADTPVVLAPYDVASTAFGAGATETGQACVILGTTVCTETIIDAPVLDGEATGLTLPLGLAGGRYLRSFPTLSGGQVIDWACRLLGMDGNPAALSELAERAPAGADGLIFLPYLSQAGERVPFLDPKARGAFHGLTVEHERHHMARAVLEGLTMVVRDCLAAAGTPATELRVSGGGSASPLWLQMMADVTGVPVVRTTDAEAGARGAFLVGAVATGRTATIGEAARDHVRVGDAYTPDPHRADIYARMYRTFLDVRTAASATWPILADARHRNRTDGGTL